MKTLQIVIAGIVSTVCMSANALGQTWHDIDPLRSAREDVVKIQKSNNQQADGKVINAGNQRIEIKYYSGGCDGSIAGELELSKDIVIQVKVEFQSDMLPPTLAGTESADVEKILLDEGQFARINHRSGFVEFSRKTTDMPETIQIHYYVPETIFLPRCLLSQLDPVLATVYKKSAHWQKGEQTDFYTSTYLEPLGLNRINLLDLRRFAETLKKNKSSSGYIYVYSNESRPEIGAEFWMNEIRNHLNEKLNVSDERFAQRDAGHYTTALAVLIVVTKRIE